MITTPDRRHTGGTEPMSEGERRADLLARLNAMNAEIQAEAQLKKDAARWKTLMKFAESDSEIMDLLDEAAQIIAFKSQVPFGEIAMMGQAPAALIDAAIDAETKLRAMVEAV